MNLHEYQAKALLSDFQLPVLRSQLCYTPREVQKAAVNLGVTDTNNAKVAIKAQILAGGRGKAGGVKIASSPGDAYQKAEAILGAILVTKQTGAAGKLVRKVLVEEGVAIAKEYYLSLLVDRSTSQISLVVSQDGGMEIEDVAAATPERIITLPVDTRTGILPWHGRSVAFSLGLARELHTKFYLLLGALYNAFCKLDCEMLEINPLVLTETGDFICLDAKMSVDDNALYRQRRAYSYLDYDEIDEREIKANELGLSYICMEGNIGCMVNGAGLAMATMDIIKQSGGLPANFLDVGGGATREKVTEAFKLILKDPAVKGVLVNIFGGIMRCDVIAEGIIEAAKILEIKVPLVVRLQGTNVELGRKLLDSSGLKINSAESMDEAAEKIVSLVSSYAAGKVS